MPVARGLADAVQKIDADVVFVLGQLHLAGEGMDVPDKSCRDLAEPVIRGLRHCRQNRGRHILLGLDDVAKTAALAAA
jgi:hypothetical protein